MSAPAVWGNYGDAERAYHLCGFTWRMDPPTDEGFSVAPYIPLTGDMGAGASADTEIVSANPGNGNGRGATAPQSLTDAIGPAPVSVSSVCGPASTAETLTAARSRRAVFSDSADAGALGCLYCGAVDGRTRAGALDCWTCRERRDAFTAETKRRRLDAERAA